MTTSVLLRKNKKGQCNSHCSLKELCGLSSVLCSLAGTRYFMGCYEYLLFYPKIVCGSDKNGGTIGFLKYFSLGQSAEDRGGKENVCICV